MLQAAATYDDGDIVRSPPVSVEFAATDKAPAITAVNATTNADGRVVLSAAAIDSENDPVRLAWFQELPESIELRVRDGTMERVNGAITCVPEPDRMATIELPFQSAAAPKEFGASVSVPAEPEGLRTQKAGLLFNHRNSGSYDFFGLFGDISAWVLASCRDGVLTTRITRGAFIRPDKDYALAVRQAADGGVECLVNGDAILRASDVQFEDRPVGVMAAGKTATYREIRFSPPCLPKDCFEAKTDGLLTATPAALSSGVLHVLASDGFRSSEQAVPATVP